MKLVLDLTSLCRRQTGLEYYALNLARALLQANGKHEFHLLFRKHVHPELKRFSGRASFHLCPFDNQIAAEQAWIPYMERKLHPDLIHFPAFSPGLFSIKNKIMTIHDSTLWTSSQRLSWKAKIYSVPLVNLALKSSQKFLTVSENAKAEIAAATGVPEEKFTVCHHAPDPIFLEPVSAAAQRAVQAKYNLPERFILSVATLEPRKNLTGLLKAFSRLVQKKPDARLVLAGRLAWGKDTVLKQLVELRLEKQALILGYVPKEDLPALYASAEFLAFPSFYEGFGLPVLEAQAAGTPVLCSQTSSLPEVAGEAALFVDPNSEENITSGLRQLWANPAFRSALIRKGKQNLERFSWRRTAEKTLATYEEVLHG